jgi:hypothetical protein
LRRRGSALDCSVIEEEFEDEDEDEEEEEEEEKKRRKRSTQKTARNSSA